ncbi:unnamed protein product [Heterobilharzia americana]|nr:unnamed protein product [Heterobilharzia americana]
MGTTTSKHILNAKHLSETLLTELGCDEYVVEFKCIRFFQSGTRLCENKELPCLNGGVCALYISDVEDKCIELCK